jgi:hypothetical protein
MTTSTLRYNEWSGSFFDKRYDNSARYHPRQYMNQGHTRECCGQTILNCLRC